MGTFLHTPDFINYISGTYRNDHGGQWTIQPLRVHVGNYAGLYHPLDSDKSYQREVLRDVMFRLRYKWLDNSSVFSPLLNYFWVERDGDKRVVRMRRSADGQRDPVASEDRKYAWRFVENVFVTKHLVRKSVERAIRKHHIHWYDVLSNSRMIKRQIYKSLDRLIKSTQEQLAARGEQ